MELILSWAGAVVLLLTIAYLIVGNAVRFIMWIKCFKVKECCNRKCINRMTCRKYRERLTESEQKELLDMTEEFKKEKCKAP